MARVRVQVPIEQTTTHQVAAVSEQPHHQQYPRRQILTRNNILVGVVILIVLVLVFTLLNDRKKLEDKVNKLSTSQGTATDVQKYQDAVGKLTEVPSGVTPKVKIPTDQEITTLIKDNNLYNSAKAGDVFLVYANQDKSLFLVIYRPSTGKIILAAPASTTATTKP